MDTRHGRFALVALLILGCEGSIGPGVGTDAPGPGGGTVGASDPGRPAGKPTAGGAPSAAAPGAPAGTGAAPAPAGCRLPPARIWKLTPDQISRTVSPLVGMAVAVDGLKSTLVVAAGSFSNAAGITDMSPPHFEAIFNKANDLASQVAGKASTLTPCLATRPRTAACVRQFIATFGERAFRRPLDPSEVETFGKFYDAQAAAGEDVGLTQVLRTIFMSPHFLYRTELGDPAATGGNTLPLTAYERASALAYSLTDGPPDAELLAAARSGALATPAQIEAQARRLLASAQLGRGLVKLLYEQLDLDRAQALPKDPKRFPRWTDQSGSDLISESQAFFEYVLWNEPASAKALWQADYTFLDDRLATLYGLPALTGSQLRRVPAAAGRAGFLTQGVFLALRANAAESDVIRRGRFVRERVLCQKMPDPPPNFAPIPPPPDGKTTQRERLARHSADPTCAGCHHLMDPVGLALENFDAIGRWRDQDAGKTIDPSGVIANITAPNTNVTSAVDLARLVAQSPEASDCLATQLYAYAHGRAPDTVDACTLATVSRRLRETGDLRQAAIDVVTADNFLVRTR